MKTLKYFTILLISIPVFLYGDIIIVDQNGTGDYYTIQEGINNSNIGDTVLVYPGNYFEIVDFIGKDKGLAILNDIKGNPVFIIQIENSLQEYDLSFLPRGINYEWGIYRYRKIILF